MKEIMTLQSLTEKLLRVFVFLASALFSAYVSIGTHVVELDPSYNMHVRHPLGEYSLDKALKNEPSTPIIPQVNFFHMNRFELFILE